MTIPRRHRLTLALLISLLLHLALIGMSGWRLPTLDDLLRTNTSPPLEAHLVPARTPPAAKQVVPQLLPHHPSVAKAAPEGAAMSHGADTLSAPVEPQPVAQPGSTAAPSAPPGAESADAVSSSLPPTSKLPRRGSIRFVVSRGDQSFIVGQSLHSWSHDGKTYKLTSITETTGIAAVFRPARVVQTSEGEIGLDGLRPRDFHTEKNGVPGDTATFDWTAMKLVLSGSAQPEVRLMTGAQDMLSLFYQFGAVYPWVPHEINEIMIATGRKFERYAFKVLDEEKLPTKFGELRVLHLRTDGDGGEAIDIWAGLELQGLPVKIRYTDRQGETFDQNAEEIEYEGMPSSLQNH